MTHRSTTYNSSLAILDNDISHEVTEDIKPPCGDLPLDITSDQTNFLKRFSKIRLDSTDIMQIDLFHLLKPSNAPLVLFGCIISWVKRYEGNITANGITGLRNRNKFIQNINLMLYGNDTFMHPIVEQIQLSSGRSTNVVRFSMKEMILHMVTDRILFHPHNLLLDPYDPLPDPPESGYHGEVNTGTWFNEAKRNECTQPNHILMSFYHIIDSLSVDKY